MQFGHTHESANILSIMVDGGDQIVDAMTHQLNALRKRLVSFRQPFNSFVNGHSGFSVADRYRSEKVTLTCARTLTGTPLLVPGLNIHFRTASMAFSSRPIPRLFTT